MKIMRTESTCNICISDMWEQAFRYPEAIEQDTHIGNDRKHIGNPVTLKRLKLIYGEKAKINFPIWMKDGAVG